MSIPQTIKISEQTPEVRSWINRSGHGYRGTHVPAVNLRLTGPGAAILLSQVEYWFRPRAVAVGPDEVNWKLRVYRESRWWIAKKDSDWVREVGLGRDQAQRAIRRLVDDGFIEHRVWKFGGTKMSHIWLDVPKLAKAQAALILELFDEVAGTPLPTKDAA